MARPKPELRTGAVVPGPWPVIADSPRAEYAQPRFSRARPPSIAVRGYLSPAGYLPLVIFCFPCSLPRFERLRANDSVVPGIYLVRVVVRDQQGRISAADDGSTR